LHTIRVHVETQSKADEQSGKPVNNKLKVINVDFEK